MLEAFRRLGIRVIVGKDGTVDPEPDDDEPPTKVERPSKLPPRGEYG